MFSPHKTWAEKLNRKVRYYLIKKRGYSSKGARRLQDWRTRNVALILKAKYKLPLIK